MSSTRLYLVRHGETDWNKPPYHCQGWMDPPLNEEGSRQAQDLARMLADEDLSAIYSSDLMRCQQTALCIGQESGLDVQVDARLRELNYGIWHGLTREERQALDPALFETWRNAPSTVTFPKGENLAQMSRRVREAIEEICARHKGKGVLVVSHWGPLRVYLAELLEVGLEHYQSVSVPNTAVIIIEFTPQGPVLYSERKHCPKASLHNPYQIPV